MGGKNNDARSLAKKRKNLPKLLATTTNWRQRSIRNWQGQEIWKKKARLEQQLSATLAERERREKDAVERYGVEVDIGLDHVVAYYIPCLCVKLELAHKDQVLTFTVFYNPLSTEIETPVCERCGRQTISLVPEHDGFVCP